MRTTNDVTVRNQRAPLLQAGETCWKLAPASRVAILLDNAAYFAAAKTALLQARQSITLIGWAFDPRVRLEPETAQPSQVDEIGALLNALINERPELEIRVLIWNAALPLKFAKQGYPDRAGRELDKRIRFHVENGIPWCAAQHQKLLLIDDVLAFCSGGDFEGDRWDTPAHLDRNPHRRLVSGKLHQPRHDVTMMVEGEAAQALAELAVERWKQATGEDGARPRPRPEVSPWPSHIAALLVDVSVAVARTVPGSKTSHAVRESEALYLAAIAAARRTLYIENEYFTSPLIGAALEARLAESDGPEIVIVCSPRSPSFFDHRTMDPPRDALITRLNAADRYGRFRAYAPHAPKGREIILHSKVAIVDDRLIRVGSSNLSNRSLGFDTECDLALEVGTADHAGVAEAIRAVRTRFIAHFLGCSESEFRDATASNRSLIAAIEAMDRGPTRRLRPLRPKAAGPIGALIAWLHLGDPQNGKDNWRPWRRRKGPTHVSWLAASVVGVAALGIGAAVWRRSRRE